MSKHVHQKHNIRMNVSHLLRQGNCTNDRDDYNDKVTSRVYLDSPQISVSKNGKQQKTKQTAYLLVNTMSQRNKRYISYLTLCHFKICNMGRKRTSRYFHMIRQLDDNEA
nr:PREDICTED: uncharacterized protein LOC103314591 isoform X2 [Tribolium castaneum]|eukprot:XP_015833687.1 PREDICTED: uncharacterized protein LOC103314591 isoform X2 [Tribolium castaneum]